MAKLFLLKPDFSDKNMDENAKFYCPSCAQILGVITYYPVLKEKLDIIYIDFKRPRKEIVDLVGEENQGCPNLIFEKDELSDLDDLDYLESYGEFYFQNKAPLIAEFLAEKYGIGVPH
ncbi:DUF3088 family protein [Flagellimonas zhangzhouensis]|uniref:DUF3088 domain-containing protein n=1 Tax=Flagellimonas zhangzhouensis TaxID=1073328 RepID=A0A1H2SJZ4_9FLAO|nr:DUF3088 family protein [Allomuricauda zhangzhouensis]SDQ75873.1 Protein of unknown function [Allomuricauda zhangzhouensis]SDW32023.1 Protein of unknown function [Allomuricauda zhangzhouensis]